MVLEALRGEGAYKATVRAGVAVAGHFHQPAVHGAAWPVEGRSAGVNGQAHSQDRVATPRFWSVVDLAQAPEMPDFRASGGRG